MQKQNKSNNISDLVYVLFGRLSLDGLDGLDVLLLCMGKKCIAHAAVQPTNLSPSNERRHRFLARLASYVMGTCGGGCGVVPLSIAFSLHVHVYKINSAALALVKRISINNINHLFHQ